MALVYDFSRRRDDATNESPGSVQFRRAWQCIVSDDLGGTVDPSTVFPSMITTQSWVSKTGYTGFQEDSNTGAPFAICNGVRCQRDPANALVFRGESTYSTDSYQNVDAQYLRAENLKATPEAYNSIWELTVRNHQEVLYEDFGNNGLLDYGSAPGPVVPPGTAPRKCRLPTGTYYTDPFYENIGAQTYIVTQFESDFSESVMLSRFHVVNGDDFLGQPPGFWLIDSVQANRVLCPCTGAPVECHMVKYRLLRNPVREWWTYRALFDSYYLKAATDIETRTEFLSKTGRAIVEGLIERDGTKRSQSAAPAYEMYIDKRVESFNEFLNTIPRNPLP
jgi:hypothetical protein